MPDAITQSTRQGSRGGGENCLSLVPFRLCLLKINFEWNYILNVALKWDLETGKQALAICLPSPFPQTTLSSPFWGTSIIQLALQLPSAGCCNSVASAVAVIPFSTSPFHSPHPFCSSRLRSIYALIIAYPRNIPWLLSERRRRTSRGRCWPAMLNISWANEVLLVASQSLSRNYTDWLNTTLISVCVCVRPTHVMTILWFNMLSLRLSSAMSSFKLHKHITLIRSPLKMHYA